MECPTIAALVATSNRETLLCERSVPTIFAQTVRGARLVVVNDGEPLSEEARMYLETTASACGVALSVVKNDRVSGAAGAWNAGLTHLWRTGHRGFVALLDDDDTWDSDHLEANLAQAEDADLVVSGLRMRAGGVIEPRPLIDVLQERDFLTGNPGWQGSNTFVAMPTMMAVGGFRDGLASLNDRDLALRLLRYPGVRWRLTGRWTATWNRDTPGNLSAAQSQPKLLGLQRFWRLYGRDMGPHEEAAFFARAERLFGFDRLTIERTMDVGSTPDSEYGSLHE